MTKLSEKIRKSREKVIEVCGFLLTIRRPTDVQMMEYSSRGKTTDLLQYVVGWEGVREMDLFVGGEGHPAQFDPESCAEWLTDNSEMFVTVINEIIGLYKDHKAELEAAEKN